jgi:N-acetylneuraminic acid mutarotase
MDSFPEKCFDDPNTLKLNDTVKILSRIDAISFSVDTVGYYGLGYSETFNLCKDFYKYSPKTNTWTKLKDFPGSARRGAISFSAKGKGYILGGDNGSLLNDLWEYNPITDSWSETSGTGSFNGRKRKNGFTFTIGNIVYIGGGVNNGVYLNDCWAFDANANTWTEKGKINNNSGDSYDDDYTIPRAYGVTFVISGKGYVTLGSNGSLLTDTWEFNPTDGLWTRKTYFEGTARNYASSFSVANRGFVLCGINGSQYFSDIWEFKPLDGAE